jgi:SAM-dependent methyltransferase
MKEAPGSKGEFYDAQYGRFATDLYSAIRRETWGRDIGQNGWITAEEVEKFIAWLGLRASGALLDVACGSGGPTLFMAERSGCAVTGVDLHESGIAQARRQAEERGLGARARFEVADGSGTLPFADASFDAITCFDAINHLPDRPRVLREWRRVLKPGGRLLLTDPITITGAITDEELRIRTSIGFFLVVPAGHDAALLRECGFEIEREEDATENVAQVAQRWHDARAARDADLRRVDGDEVHERQQRFLEVTARLARERRLSRVVVVARRSAPALLGE